ncbi:MAG: hypothetical protein RLP44_02300 [Aggregatilineales bacterium]
MQVTLLEIFTDSENEGYYVLRVADDNSDIISDIPLLDMSPTTGLTVAKWKTSTRKRDQGKRVIGVYFWISIMGHELDQWRYYDLDLGKDVSK